MRRRSPVFLSSVFGALVAAVLCSSVPRAQTTAAPLLLRAPAISQTSIAFSYGGDLWIVDRPGGDARRLTSDVGIETNAMFSPDGSAIAFTGEYDGNEDVYLISAAGGIPKRLTTHPSSDQVAGWSRDGKRVLFRSDRDSYSRFNRLFTVATEGGLPVELPLPMAEQGAFSPDGARLEVELDPSAWRQGHDPQLEKAVAGTLEELKLHPAAPVKEPKFPVYNWPVLR